MNKHKASYEGIKVVGIDLAKRSFQVHGVNGRGAGVMSRRLSRKKLLVFMESLSPCLVGMEACGSAHFWARRFREMGHQVRLMAPQFVKPYVKSNKNDGVDAEAICEAVQRPNMRFVSIKEVGQQDIQSWHRVRSLVVARRTAQVNQIRGLLLEYGIEIPKGRHNVRKRLPEILEDGENGLSFSFRGLLSGLYQDLVQLDERVAQCDAEIEQMARESEACQRLLSIPGIGAQAATALVAAVGDVRVFRNGREMAAWLGLVPRQHSTGGKVRLLGISKRGDVYLRMLLVHGARSVVRFAGRKEDRTSRWVTGLESRRGKNIAAVALANKMVRTAWALLTKGESYGVEMART
jgi:transposase